MLDPSKEMAIAYMVARLCGRQTSPWWGHRGERVWQGGGMLGAGDEESSWTSCVVHTSRHNLCWDAFLKYACHQDDICLKIRKHLWFYRCCTILLHSQALLPPLLVGQGPHEETAALRPEAICTPCSTGSVVLADKSHPCFSPDALLCMFPVAVSYVIPCNKL